MITWLNPSRNGNAAESTEDGNVLSSTSKIMKGENNTAGAANSVAAKATAADNDDNGHDDILLDEEINEEADRRVFFIRPEVFVLGTSIRLRGAGLVEETLFHVRIVYNGVPRDVIVTSARIGQLAFRLGMDDIRHGQQHLQRSSSSRRRAKETQANGQNFFRLAADGSFRAMGITQRYPKQPKKESPHKTSSSFCCLPRNNKKKDDEIEVQQQQQQQANDSADIVANLEKLEEDNQAKNLRRRLLHRHASLKGKLGASDSELLSRREVGQNNNAPPLQNLHHGQSLFAGIAFGRKENIRKRMDFLETYLQGLLDNLDTRNNAALQELLHVRRDSYDERYGPSINEGWVRVTRRLFSKAEARIPLGLCMLVIIPTCNQSSVSYWAVLRNSSVSFYKAPNDPLPAKVLLLDNGFVFHALPKDPSRMILECNYEVIQMKFHHVESKSAWARDIVTVFVQNQRKVRMVNPMDYISPIRYEESADVSWTAQRNRFESFSPIRKDQAWAKFLIDGEATFEAIALAMEEADEEIFIQGWWITPDVPLIRDSKDSVKQYRLLDIIQRKAESGVHVYVLMFNEVRIAISLDSMFQESRLPKHKNIHIVRHPSTYKPSYWSHHEKVVCVDQIIGFCGGIDICWGRYDNHHHSLFDNESKFPGLDYCNPRVKDFTNVKNVDKSIIDPSSPRLPWHDLHCQFFGAPARDLARHFIHQYNNACHQMRPWNSDIVPKDFLVDIVLERKVRAMKLAYIKRYKVLGRHAETTKPNISIPVSSSSPLPSPSFKLRETKSEPIFETQQNNLEVNSHMPAIEENEENNNNEDNNNQPQSEIIVKEIDIENGNSNTSLTNDVVINNSSKLEEEKKEEESVTEKKAEDDNGLFEVFGYQVHCQITRSLPPWSAQNPSFVSEHSIETAYLQLIENAENFIYIENQFFVSSAGTGVNQIHNQISHALFRRIQRAAREKKPFKVMILLPLLPAFEGQVSDKNASALYNVLHWQYKSISRGPGSLYEMLKNDPYVTDPKDYVIFFGLRTFDVLGNNITSEIIYIHSKMMIIDDCACIIGSANINDRSLTGRRDSEICAVIEGKEFVKELRSKLLQEHLGALSDAPFVLDPGNPENFKYICELAHQNTIEFSKSFGCVPSDDILTYADLLAHVRENQAAAGGGGQISHPEKSDKTLLSEIGEVMEETFIDKLPKMDISFRPNPLHHDIAASTTTASTSTDGAGVDVKAHEQMKNRPKLQKMFSYMNISRPANQERRSLVTKVEPFVHHLKFEDVPRSQKLLKLIQDSPSLFQDQRFLLTIRGNLVNFPLDFLKNETDLRSKSILSDEIYT